MSTNFLEDIEKYQEKYYLQTKKNTFFKNSQKIDCATKLCSEFNKTELIEKTLYIIPNTNKVYINYPMFKLYANPDLYNEIVEKLLELFIHCINTFGDFECHINLNTFTITAANRYKQVIELFSDKCFKNETKYSTVLSKLYIYNSPGMIEAISRIFLHLIDPLVRSKIVLFNKSESGGKLNDLLV
jgi:hypothetical protein